MTENPVTISNVSIEQALGLFSLLPTPALIIDYKGRVLEFNKHALTFLKFKDKDQYLHNNQISTIFVDFKRTMKIIEDNCCKQEINSQKILLRKYDKSIECVDFYSSYISGDKELIIIQFTKISEKNRVLFSELTFSIKNEVLKLKPYLNKPGRELLDQILTNSVFEGEINQTSVSGSHLEVIQKERIAKILQIFPNLTNAELTLCGFLSLKMTIEEIALLTGKTSNCLRVLFHRMLLKTNQKNGKEFIRKLTLIE